MPSRLGLTSSFFQKKRRLGTGARLSNTGRTRGSAAARNQADVQIADALGLSDDVVLLPHLKSLASAENVVAINPHQ
jgi:hypothetical protein